MGGASSTSKPLFVAAILLGFAAPASVDRAFAACVDYRESRALASELSALLGEGQAELRDSLGTRKPGDLTREQEDLFDQVVEARRDLLDATDALAGATKEVKQALSKSDPEDKDTWIQFFDGARAPERLDEDLDFQPVFKQVEEACTVLSFQNFGSLARDFSKRIDTKLLVGPRKALDSSYPAGPTFDPIVFSYQQVSSSAQALQNNCYCRDGKVDEAAVIDAGNKALKGAK